MKKNIPDIIQGLFQEEKYISSKYFYDDIGCLLYQEITKLPEYYLTGCEKNILEKNIFDIVTKITNSSDPSKKKFRIVEIGPGDGEKALLISEKLFKADYRFSYYGLDICSNALTKFKALFEERLPYVVPELVVGDFNEINGLVEKIKEQDNLPTLFLFLGSSIGNFNSEEAVKYLKNIKRLMTKDDALLVGFDLIKEKDILERAYNDSLGVTAQFNINLIERMNRELGFNLLREDFYHLEYFDEIQKTMVSFLVSKKDQEIAYENEKIHISKDEKIHTEYSFKYDNQIIEELAMNAGLDLKTYYFDSNRYFTNALFTINN